MLRTCHASNQDRYYLTRGFESKTDTAVVSQAFLGLVTFTVQENSWLLLESFLVLLIGHASKHS